MKMLHLPWHGRDVPNAALDILRGCNASCRNCFNLHSPHIKPFDEVADDLETLLKSRNIHTITISGGEPLLHPELTKIIRHCCQKSLHVSVLSNGILLDEKTAFSLRDAGCEAIFLHIQGEQKRPDLPENPTENAVYELRREKIAVLRAAGIIPGLSVIAPKNDMTALAKILKEYLELPDCEYLLMTIEQEMHGLTTRTHRNDVDVAPLLDTMRNLGFRPFSWLGGMYRGNVPRWFAFQSVERVNHNGVRTGWHAFSPSITEWLFLRIQRIIDGRYCFLTGSSAGTLKLRLLLNPLTGGNISALPFLLYGLVRGESFRGKHIVLEFPPYWLDDTRLEHCANCPDMTVHHGKLVPLCMSDFALRKEDV